MYQTESDREMSELLRMSTEDAINKKVTDWARNHFETYLLPSLLNDIRDRIRVDFQEAFDAQGAHFKVEVSMRDSKGGEAE